MTTIAEIAHYRSWIWWMPVLVPLGVAVFIYPRQPTSSLLIGLIVIAFLFVAFVLVPLWMQ